MALSKKAGDIDIIINFHPTDSSVSQPASPASLIDSPSIYRSLLGNNYHSDGFLLSPKTLPNRRYCLVGGFTPFLNVDSQQDLWKSLRPTKLKMPGTNIRPKKKNEAMKTPLVTILLFSLLFTLNFSTGEPSVTKKSITPKDPPAQIKAIWKSNVDTIPSFSSKRKIHERTKIVLLMENDLFT